MVNIVVVDTLMVLAGANVDGDELRVIVDGA